MSRPRYSPRNNRQQWERIRPTGPSIARRRRALRSQQARNRPGAEKQAIWNSIKRNAPEVADLLKAFPGATVLSWEENGQMIGEDYSG